MKMTFIIFCIFLTTSLLSCNYKKEIKSEEVIYIVGDLYYFPASTYKEGISKKFILKDRESIDKITHHINEAYESGRGKKIFSQLGILEMQLLNNNNDILYCFRIYIESNQGTIIVNESCNNSHAPLGYFNNDKMGDYLKDYFKNEHQINLQ